ncbi:MAG: hypothetical protein AB7N24_23705, partial [Dehalococcoidia bacterium]
DGSMRAGGGFAWALAANPFEGRQPGESIAGIRGATGTYSPTEVDLTFPALVPWVIGRTHNARQELSSSHHNSDGYQGKNWFQISQPEIVLFDNDSNSGTREEEDLIYLVYGADRYAEFVRTADNEDTFRGVNGTAGMFLYVSGSPDTYVYTDQVGNRTYFFGSNASNTAAWQVWKFVDPAGNTAYVGTSAGTSGDGGYSSGRIQYAFDSSDRRYTYTYTTLDSVDRLTQVKAEIQTGGTWASPGTVTEVGRVDYSFYQSGGTTDGDVGNLKLVTTTTPLSKPDSGSTPNLSRRQYYRYYTGTYNATTNPGHPNTIKMVVGHEGVRRYDWLDAAFDDDFIGAAEGDLKPYSDAYFKYDSSYRIVSVFANGECGCSGALNGEQRFTYETNPGFSGTSGYDTTWEHRTVVEPPSGGAWVTQYFDEVGQSLSRVLSDADPVTASNVWVTKIVRNGAGQVTQLHTPANATAYTHNTGGNPSGAITNSGSVGLVYYYQRETTGDLTGFVIGVRQQEGDTTLSSTSTYLSWTTFGTRDLSYSGVSAKLTRPVISATRAFHTAGTNPATPANYDETTMTYDWWDNTPGSTSTDYITLKSMTTGAPAVSAGKNGSGSSTSTIRYVRRDGTTAYSVSARGIFTYTEHANGQVVQLIEDVQTTDTTDIAGADDPNGTWGISESAAGEHRITLYTYDAQGRPDETELPDGRITKKVYAALGSQRPVTFSIPRVASYHGPAGYTVTNQAGSVEDCLIIAVDTPTSDSPAGWVNTAISGSSLNDPILSFNSDSNKRRLVRLTHSEYNETGRRLTMRAVAFDMPADLASLDYSGAGQNADAWYLKYDDLGRQVRLKDPTGTIGLTVYDVLSRVTSRQIGTNDPDEAGTDDMVTTEAMVYDGGSAGGNSYLTQSTSYVVDSTTNQRVTSYTNDYRGRLVLTVGPLAPFPVTKYDNRSRVVATGLYSSSGSLTVSTDPTSTTSARVALSQTFYDERGQVYKSQRHKINQSTGADDDNLQTLNWYDPDGRLIKSDGEQLTKTRYDRLGRTIQSFVLANDNDTANTYTDVYDTTNMYASLSGDKVLEEHQMAYDVDDKVLMSATISRNYSDTSTTGPLDITYDSGDGDPLQFTDTDVKGRIQITAMWYDDLDRPTTTAVYGTNSTTGNVATFDRDGLSAPTASSSSVIVSKTVYSEDGTVLETSDPKSTESRFLYDDAGRLVATIANYTGGSTSTAVRDNDLYTRYTYASTLQTEMWVDIDGDGTQDSDDQVTTYVYGTTKGTAGSGSPIQSAIGTGHLLREVIYPAQSGGQSAADRTVTYAYNAQGEQVWMKDQEGNIIETNLDTAGRETDRRVTNAASGFDTAVLRISTAYLSRGLVDTVTQYNNAAVGSGTATDQVQYSYDGWGNVTTFKQDPDSLISGGSGRSSFQVDYAYAKAGGTAGRNTIRRSSMSLPGTTAVTFDYLSTGSKLDADSSRVSQMNVSINLGAAVTVAKYEYLGAAQVVGTDLPQPKARWQYYEGASGGDPYPDLDQFNRVTDSRWTGYKTGGAGSRNFYDVDITYDEASNITAIVDNVLKAGVSGNRNFDAQYTLDALYRLKRAQEGTYSGGSISN